MSRSLSPSRRSPPAWPWRCVWRNELGGLTFELPSASRFLKWAPAASGLPLLNEAMRLRWASPYTPVPEVVDAGTAADGSTWLLTERLSGTSAISDRWKAAPRTAVSAIGEALRAFHEALPVESCPFTWTAQEHFARAQVRAAAGTIDPMEWHRWHRHLSVDDAIDTVSEPPPVDRLVVCHGDSCSPNTLVKQIADSGRLRWRHISVRIGRSGAAVVPADDPSSRAFEWLRNCHLWIQDQVDQAQM